MSEVLWFLLLSTCKKGLTSVLSLRVLPQGMPSIIRWERSFPGQASFDSLALTWFLFLKEYKWRDKTGLTGMMLAKLSSRGFSSGDSLLQPVHVGDLRWLEKQWSFLLCFSCRLEDESENYNRAAEAAAAGDEESQVCPGACPSLHSALWRCPPGMDGCIMGMVTLSFPAKNKSQV